MVLVPGNPRRARPDRVATPEDLAPVAVPDVQREETTRDSPVSHDPFVTLDLSTAKPSRRNAALRYPTREYQP